jgi:hypothetical protein
LTLAERRVGRRERWRAREEEEDATSVTSALVVDSREAVTRWRKVWCEVRVAWYF